MHFTIFRVSVVFASRGTKEAENNVLLARCCGTGESGIQVECQDIKALFVVPVMCDN